MSEYDRFRTKQHWIQLQLNSGHEIFIHLITAVKFKGVDKGGGARGLKPPHFLRFILSNNIAVHCILRENICIYALNNIPAPPLLQTCLRP